mgnify:CR=1 FL=1
MAEVRLIDVREEILAENRQEADDIRAGLKRQGIFIIDLEKSLERLRVAYDAVALAALRNHLFALTPAERIGFLSDEWALVRRGQAEIGSFLELGGEVFGHTSMEPGDPTGVGFTLGSSWSLSPRLAVLAAAALGWWYARTSGPVFGPIVVVSIDSLRADRLPAYGYAKVKTPALDALTKAAKGGVVVPIARELNLPIRYIGVGEKTDDLLPFEPEKFVASLFEA